MTEWPASVPGASSSLFGASARSAGPLLFSALLVAGGELLCQGLALLGEYDLGLHRGAARTYRARLPRVARWRPLRARSPPSGDEQLAITIVTTRQATSTAAPTSGLYETMPEPSMGV